METKNNRVIGAHGEKLAEQFLIKKGLKILDKNVVIVHAELDIIAKDKNEIVFVEVKYRRGKNYGLGEEAVTKSKIRNLGKAADIWMFRHHHIDTFARFDVISILELEEGKPEISWYKDAITLF